MADQATLKRFDGTSSNGAAAGRSASGGSGQDLSASGMVSNVASLGENLLTLSELQARLAAVELRQNLKSLQTGGALAVAGSILAVASVPVVMVGVAELMVSELGVKRGYALLGVSAVAVVIAIGCAAIAHRWVIKNPLGFPLSSEEFARNMNWLRTILRHSGRWPYR
jgi:Putative Actinobacterial Holin-X, holin superfamily III